MDIGLRWLGVAVGLLGSIAAYRTAARSEGVEADERLGGRTRTAAAFTLLLTLIFYAVAMQTREPFSTGQRLGFGFLIGGLTGVIAQFLASRLASQPPDEEPDDRPRMRLLCTAFFGLFGAALTFAIFRGDPQTALVGFAVGAVMAGILYYYAQDLGTPYIRTWMLTAVTIAAGTWLAVAHFDSVQQRNWWPMPILITSTILIAVYASVELSALSRLEEWPGLRALVPLATLLLLVLGLNALYSWKVIQDWALLGVVAVGIIVAAVASWLGSRLGEAQDGADGLDAASAVVLLAVAFAVAAFRLWGGLGIALGLLAAWAVALFQYGTGQASKDKALFGLLSFGLVILLFRVFIEAYRRDLGAADLRIHYTFIGALLGAILPFTFVSSLARLKASADSDRAILARVAFIGAVAALSPILLYLLWDIKVVLGLIFGLTAATAFLLMASLSREESLLGRCSIVPLVLGAQLSAIVFTGPLVEFEFTRLVRISILGGIVLIAAVWLVVTGIAAARRAR